MQSAARALLVAGLSLILSGSVISPAIMAGPYFGYLTYDQESAFGPVVMSLPTTLGMLFLAGAFVFRALLKTGPPAFFGVFPRAPWLEWLALYGWKLLPAGLATIVATLPVGLMGELLLWWVVPAAREYWAGVLYLLAALVGLCGVLLGLLLLGLPMLAYSTVVLSMPGASSEERSQARLRAMILLLLGGIPVFAVAAVAPWSADQVLVPRITATGGVLLLAMPLGWLWAVGWRRGGRPWFGLSPMLSLPPAPYRGAWLAGWLLFLFAVAAGLSLLAAFGLVLWQAWT